MLNLRALTLAACLLTHPLANAQDAHTPTAQHALDDALRLLSTGDRDAALQRLHLALHLDPRHWPTYLVLGDLYDQDDLAQTAKALEYYEIFADNAQPWSPGQPEALERLLRCHQRLRDWTGAALAAERLARFRHARREHALARDARRQRAHAELLAGQPDQALDTLHGVLFEDANDPLAHRLRAHARLALGRPQEALLDLRFVRDHFGQDDFIHRDLGLVLFRLRRYDEAADALQRSLRIDGEHVDTLRWLARALEALGDLDHAETLYRRGLALGADGPRLAPLRNDLAWLLALQSRPGDPRLLAALSLAHRAVQDTHADDPALCDTLAEILLRLGRPDDALRWASRALLLAPADPWFQAQHRRALDARRGLTSRSPRQRLARLPPPRALPALTPRLDTTR